jgi:hypothetical protein
MAETQALTTQKKNLVKSIKEAEKTEVHIYTSTHLHTYTPTHLHTYTPTHLHTYTPTHLHIYTYPLLTPLSLPTL